MHIRIPAKNRTNAKYVTRGLHKRAHCAPMGVSTPGRNRTPVRLVEWVLLRQEHETLIRGIVVSSEQCVL